MLAFPDGSLQERAANERLITGDQAMMRPAMISMMSVQALLMKASRQESHMGRLP